MSEPPRVTLVTLPPLLWMLPEFAPEPPTTSRPIFTAPMSPDCIILPLSVFEPPTSEPPMLTPARLPSTQMNAGTVPRTALHVVADLHRAHVAQAENHAADIVRAADERAADGHARRARHRLRLSAILPPRRPARREPIFTAPMSSAADNPPLAAVRAADDRAADVHACQLATAAR